MWYRGSVVAAIVIVTLASGPQQNLHVEHEPVARTLAVQLPRKVAPVHLEPALRVGEFLRRIRKGVDDPSEQPPHQPPVQPLRAADEAFGEPPRPVRDLARAASDKFDAARHIVKWYAQAAVGEEDVPAA